MIYVDGSRKSGSGTILRFTAGLATLLGEELHLTNIRAGREKPGHRLFPKPVYHLGWWGKKVFQKSLTRFLSYDKVYYIDYYSQQTR